MLEDLEVVFLNESGSGPGRVMIERTCNMSVEHCNLQCFMRHMRPKHPKPNKMQLFLIPLQNFTKTAEKESKPLRALTCKCIKKTQLRHFCQVESSLIDCGLWVVLIFAARAGFVHVVVRRIC